ncbi:DUF1501 domain-containing protein [Lentisphaera profundi]|uniref:DUF1501 domain-containing protein n=1 Tax=Lentisphaera profundi TaxID=1658616 RepID=A0ABY7W1F5_9BACT|nr:DUF1501 domain-containing protein [Lentisphaera profundi]WDE98814.1 DUF1501 domain-containing protein [Lentisphaera profundi]
MDRRNFLKMAAALGSSAGLNLSAAENTFDPSKGILGAPHHAAKAKRVIYLFMGGGPSQFETFDNKPLMKKMHGKELPKSIIGETRLTGMSGNQSSLPVAASPYKFSQHGECGMELSELLPHTAKIVDDIALVKTMYTEAINHGPAKTFLQTGSQLAGRPSMGAWLNYGLGTDNPDMPPFVVMRTKGKGGQPLFAGLWGNGFLPSEYQGVMFRPEDDPVLYLNNPGGIARNSRRSVLDSIQELEALKKNKIFDPAIDSRLAQYEMAYRMQKSVPNAVDMSDEDEETLALYGPDVKKPGSFANNCLMARRLAERDVKFIQLYHQGWDAHGGCPGGVKGQCRDTDQAAAGLVMDLKQRGLLDDTLVIFGGEFGRTAYSQGKMTETNYGRDHHPACFPTWFAGGGIKGGTTFGQTDEFSYNIVGNDKMHVHDFHATIMHLLGIDHTRLTYRFQGRNFRLTDVHGHIIKKILA